MTLDNSSRRGFITGAAALAGLHVSENRLPAQQADDVKLGVATYSFRKFSRAQMIEMMKPLRTPYVCIKEFHLRYNSTAEELAAARKEFEAAGLTIYSGGVIYLEKPGEVRKMFEYAKLAGMPMIICGPTHATLGEMEKMVKEFNIRAAIHNHGPEDKEFPTPQVALEAIRNMDPRVGVCVDIGHTARAGGDIIDALRASGPRLFDIHIKDMLDTSRRPKEVPVGEGILPIVTIFKTLRKMNFRGSVMLEYEIDADNPLPGMKESFAYMRGVLAGLRG